jgi:hypothetical protein
LARSGSTLCLPISTDAYLDVIDDPRRFRSWLDQAFRDCPELFPQAFANGYRRKDERSSTKTGLRLRRVRLQSTGEAFSLRPSFVLPYLTGYTDDVQGPLFRRAFGVPFGATARASAGRRTPPDARWPEELPRHPGRGGLLPGCRPGPNGRCRRLAGGLRGLPAGSRERPARLPAANGERRWLVSHPAGVAGLVPFGAAAALLPARLAEPPPPGQVERGVYGVGGEGGGRL